MTCRLFIYWRPCLFGMPQFINACKVWNMHFDFQNTAILTQMMVCSWSYKVRRRCACLVVIWRTCIQIPSVRRAEPCNPKWTVITQIWLSNLKWKTLTAIIQHWTPVKCKFYASIRIVSWNDYFIKIICTMRLTSKMEEFGILFTSYNKAVFYSWLAEF